MPDTGGIFYTADMTLFYQTFFKNPTGDWRYMLGFEPTWMPRKDFEVFQQVLWNSGDAKAYAAMGEGNAAGGPARHPRRQRRSTRHPATGMEIQRPGHLARAHAAPHPGGTPPPTIPATVPR